MIEISNKEMKMIGLQDAAKFLGVTTATILNWKNKNKISYERDKRTGNLLFSVDDLMKKQKAADELGIKLSKPRKK